MTTNEQYQFCKRCTNRKLDTKQGIVCTLTHAKPTFTDNCEQFNPDPQVEALLASNGNVNHEQILATTYKGMSIAELKQHENYSLACIAGGITGIIGAILWGLISVALMIQFGYMAIAIGAGVGYVMRITGKGVSQKFAITGAFIAIVSCFLGNVFSLFLLIAKFEDVTLLEVITYLDYSQLPDLLTENFSFFDVLFPLIAALEGYKFATIPISE
ncbi:hypothetical protein [Neptunitalea lumnitzerae]|uniref:Uncharacterized protein n=1 Tax=Neptunitalea lumnitzerae TaxID=2965509 RepID=A0ABQ5MIG4_9FLAO|nr:hypothetical protein [Neptunitalea sp. Y10]GLB49193.1 hypothetical protein Y10_15610 [Neptunitalea sp. Y10]